MSEFCLVSTDDAIKDLEAELDRFLWHLDLFVWHQTQLSRVGELIDD